MPRLHAAALCALLIVHVACDPKADCLAGSTRCDGTCVRLATDGEHCGACGVACPAGSVCSAGVCAAACAAPLATCTVDGQEACADTRVDPANCGACGRACAGGQVCDQGECTVTCTGAGSRLCSDRCVDVATDVANCGGCGVACEAGTTCAAGTCIPTCPAGQARCDDRCVDLASDSQNCGTCGEACPDFGVCAGGACTAPTCAAGFGLPGAPDMVGAFTLTVTVVDADRDGRLDLVTSPAASVWDAGDVVQVLKNLGGRRFTSAPPLPVGMPVETVRAGDVDGDGIPDLVVGWGTDVKILRGLAAGGFGAPSSAVAMSGTAFYELAVADVSGDGRADVLSASAGGLSVRLGNAAGGLGARAEYRSATGDMPTTLAIGDVNGDGLTDVVTGQYFDGHFGVYLNLGDGTFGEPVVYSSYWRTVQALALADVDRDGDLDVVGAGDGLVVLLNASDGTLGAPVLYTTGDGDSLAVADFDGDGFADAAVGNFNDPRKVDLFRNAGDGTFLGPEPYYDAGPWALAAADLDGDRRVDLAAASSVGAGVHLLWNEGPGFAQSIRSGALVTPWGLALGDLDGDGHVDAVVADHTTGNAALLLGDGRGSFVHELGFEGRDAMAGDLDGDRDDDLIVYATSAGGDPVLRSLRLEAGVLVEVQELPGIGSPGLSLAALGDLDHDGNLDLLGVAASPGPSQGDQLVWLRGLGDGAFATAVALDALDAWGVNALALGDVDGNGWVDVVAMGGNRELLVWRNLGSGSFVASAVPISGIDFPSHALALGDLDGDGVLDVAYSHETLSTNGVGVLRGNGDGSFTQLPQLPRGLPPRLAIGAPGGRQRNLLFAADALVAGAVDLVEVGANGTLALVGRWSAGTVIGPLALRDVDGDLRPDLVMATVGGLTVRLAKCLP